ncbi:DUF3078 domain-containing protein [Arsenicibacter rosenii]|uniref:DUF3078 domain-containing protein n=1 Tax=Arsenicibacter rosenii TaxID=1750698 RepID=A0A1S2VEN3_9BACT|nr:DUF3078 domain-containing protein [Arsenicibacter rosenii]OIN57184.1 hypothetical protein BLX24_20695 [Arsenicibacter rosenii]
MKLFYPSITLLILALSSIANAQTSPVITTNFADTLSVRKDTTYWQKSFAGGLNLNQASFSNWTGGGINSIALSTVVNARALYEKGLTSWDNTADLQLGYVTQRGDTRKAADQIFINSVVGHKLTKKMELFGSGTFNTFFAPGYRYDKLATDQKRLLVSNFLAPAQITLAWGAAFRPNDWFSLRLSPFSPRLTIVNDADVRVKQVNGIYVKDPNVAAFGVDPGKTTRMEWLALQLQVALNKKLGENVSLNARYQLYANYKNLNAIDHRLDAVLTAKVSKYLSTTLGLILLYDKDFADKLQIQQTLAIGLSYNISTFRKK